MNMNDFRVIKLLGRGAFGEVNLCQSKLNNEYYAVKKLKKSEMVNRQEAFFMEERELLGLAQGTWITRLEHAFQDSEYLYLVMEYLAGGNLLSLLYKQEVFDIEYTRFYLAEAILGIREIHNLGFVYRDLKPDNMMLDRHGHIKLADFGSAIRVDEKGFVPSNVPVGTPYYIAPEVLKAQDGRDKYSFESDWWSLGIVLYEVMVGEPPFYNDSMLKTYGMIMNHKQHLSFSDDLGLTAEAIDLIKKLLCDKEERLTYDGIRSHPFFAGVDWDNLHTKTPPFVPELAGPDDTSNFDEDFDDVAPTPSYLKKGDRPSEFSGEDLSFVGYTFSRVGIFSGDGATKDAAKAVIEHTALSRQASDMSRTTEVEFRRYREDAERWQTKFKESQQKTQQLEALRDQLASDLDKKERAASAEVASRRSAEQHAEELEKGKKVLEIELEETKRKLASDGKAKATLESRISELEELLAKQKKDRESLLASTRSAESGTKELEENIASLTEQIKDRSSQISALEARIAELVAARTALEENLKEISTRLENEKEAHAVTLTEIASLKASLSKAASQNGEKDAETQRLTQQAALLQSQLTTANEALEHETQARASLARVKNDIESKRALLEVDVSRISEQLKVAEQKRKAAVDRVAELEASIATQGPTSPVATNGAGNDRELESVRAELIAERDILARQNAQVEELNKEKASLVVKLGDLQSSFDEQRDLLNAAQRKVADLQAEAKLAAGNNKENVDARKLLEERVAQLQSELSTAETAASRDKSEARKFEELKTTLTSQLAAAEAKARDLQRAIDDDAGAKKKLQDQLEELRAKQSKEKTTSKQLQEDAEEAASAKETAERELEKVKRQLEELTQSTQAQDAELAALRKESGLLRVEHGQLEKRLAAELQAKEQLESQLEEKNASSASSAVQAAELQCKVDDLTTERDQLLESVTELRNKESETEAASGANQKILDDLHIQLRVKDDQLKQFIKRAEVTSTPSEMNIKLRKVRDENARLQAQLDGESKARKHLERELGELKSQKERADREIEELRKASAATAALERKTSSASAISAAGSSGSKRSSTMMDAAAGAGESFVNFLRKTTIRRQNSTNLRPGLSNLKPTSNDFNLTDRGFEGWLKMPKEKGVRQGWIKRFIVVRDSKVYLVDKDNKHQSEAQQIADVKADVFIVREPTKNGLMHVNAKELPLIFLIYVMQTAPVRATASVEEIKEAAPKPAVTAEEASTILTARLASMASDRSREQKILEGAQAMLKLSKDSQQKKLTQLNVESSQKKIVEIGKEIARTEALLAKAKAGEAVEVDATAPVASPVKGGKQSVSVVRLLPAAPLALIDSLSCFSAD